MNHNWSIDQPRPDLHLVHLEPVLIEGEPQAIADQLSGAITELGDDCSLGMVVEVDFRKWHEVNSKVFAFLIYFQRRCRERGYKLTISSPPRQLVEMASRLGLSIEFGLGASQSSDYRQLFLQDSRSP